MIIIDRLLQQRRDEGRSIRVGMVGSGFMARGIARQLLHAVAGVELVAISNRHLNGARRAYIEAGCEDVAVVETRSQFDEELSRGRRIITDNFDLLCKGEGIDAIIEVTGTVEFGAAVVMSAIEHAKHVVLMNAELDGTVGPILKRYADRAGVVITNADGDQPGVTMNLYRFVKGIGVKPVMCGNIKGLHDPYRNPTTQESFARKWGQNPNMVTSFADGTKISFEQAIVANATGMRVAKRGMHGPVVPAGTHVHEAANWYPREDLLRDVGFVDYVVGAAPAPGVFVLGTHDDPNQQHYLKLYKLGEGPFYCFYTPYHLCHFEVHNSVARAVLLGDATIAPQGRPCVDVVATAKKDLERGSILDGIGQYMLYGQCENAEIVQQQHLLPMGLAEGCRLKRNVPKDQILTYDDVTVPEGRLCDELRASQSAVFFENRIALSAR